MVQKNTTYSRHDKDSGCGSHYDGCWFLQKVEDLINIHLATCTNHTHSDYQQYKVSEVKENEYKSLQCIVSPTHFDKNDIQMFFTHCTYSALGFGGTWTTMWYSCAIHHLVTWGSSVLFSVIASSSCSFNFIISDFDINLPLLCA